jgi:hypothetical protein
VRVAGVGQQERCCAHVCVCVCVRVCVCVINIKKVHMWHAQSDGVMEVARKGSRVFMCVSVCVYVCKFECLLEVAQFPYVVFLFLFLSLARVCTIEGAATNRRRPFHEVRIDVSLCAATRYFLSYYLLMTRAVKMQLIWVHTCKFPANM